MLFPILSASNGFLFYYCQIWQEYQWKTFVIAYFIAIGFLMFIFDWAISIVAASLIKNGGIVGSRGLSTLIIYGFIGFNRIRCL